MVAETWWALVQVDALTGPSGCSNMSKLFLDVTVLTQGEKETGNVCCETSMRSNTCIVPLNLPVLSFTWVPPFGWKKVSDGAFALTSSPCMWKDI